MFDPFRDFDTAGYLRNSAGEKNSDIIKRLEHGLFTANLQDAMDCLQKKRVITDQDFLNVHEILFGDLYPWAGRDRMATAPDLAISKADTKFCHPAHSKRAVEEALRIGAIKKEMQKSPGLVMGLFAYGHPFLDGNGRTMLVVHSVLCNRAGFSINWCNTNKTDYLSYLSAEIASPGKRILDDYVKNFMDAAQDPKMWCAVIESIKGLDGRPATDIIEGTFRDPAVSRKYHDFEQQRGYKIVPPSEPTKSA